MTYVPVYDSRINWENAPSVNTPINDFNLNLMDYALYKHDESLGHIFNESVKRVDFNTSTKDFVITYWNGTVETFNLNLELIPATFSLDSDAVVHMIDNHGNEYTADLKENIYYMETVSVAKTGTATATTTAQDNIVVNAGSDDPTLYEIAGTKHMMQTVTSISDSQFSVVFENEGITENGSYDVYTSVDDLNYDHIIVTDGRCEIQYSDFVGTVTVVLYIK